MLSALKYFLAAAIIVSIIVKSNGAMRVYDQAEVYLSPWWCTPLHGVMRNGTCKVTADYSRDFYSGKVLLRQKRLDGTYVTWEVTQERDIKMQVLKNSHYEFFKNWTY